MVEGKEKIIKHPYMFNIWNLWMETYLDLWATYHYAEIERDERLKNYAIKEKLNAIYNNNYVVIEYVS